MSFRTVIVSSRAKLDSKMGYLVVRGEETKRVLLDEIETLVVEHPAVALTGCLLEDLVSRKVKVIFCDAARNPVAELVPHHGSHDSASKIRTQIAWSSAVKAAVWQEIVSEKIRKQAALLEEHGKEREAALLTSYIGQVQPLDASNREGHAAKVYFNALFGMGFTRTADTSVNAALNYGYSLILSAFNREIAANGYLTQLGIFHNNTFNHFNLGCDLMEPFRVLIDRQVSGWQPTAFGKAEKHMLWTVLEQPVQIGGSKWVVSDAIKRYTRSAFTALNDQDVSALLFYDWI
ncbi:MAG: type II CRISPR-associated endonuclease Cas1 [Clostridia bacterium]|nr:type II CRISPR-associated endonuclease Cas1 [Clostridia bacterium]